VPALINSASYDIFTVGSIRNFHGMRTGAGTEPKNFCSYGAASGKNHDSDGKVFCFFSSKKKALLR
jgi:hypothetical protein